ncbi:M16 family metallopeptidase [Streptomyces achromogenes]|uniref:M16 family metallopeptidase n=1 Tax=Streptomyces achromogenes TaxID=67255 RepID=UPI00371D777F
MHPGIHHPAGGGEPPAAVRRRTLGNGLRVVLAPFWPGPRAAVGVHYGVGFRSELPGQEGLAHLFEHLMFRGSESLPDGGFFDGIHPLAGTANGTTHQDYTDYVQVLPAAALEQALFREADRMRAPLFTETQLAAQLSGVAREIAHVRDDRPYGGCPWPLLPRVLFRDFAHAHDGYGDIERLRRTTVADCAAFFDAHYTPANAVLTVVGPFAPEDVWPLVERHFGDIPGRRPLSPPPAHEPPPSEDTWLTCREPGVERTAVALGHRLPDPVTALPDYLAHMVLARLLGRPDGGGTDGLPAPVSAGCGFFGPLDTRGPDALVVTALLPPGLPPTGFRQALADWAARHSTPGAVAERAVRAAAFLGAQHRRTHAGLQERCRALGRLELLYDRAELVDEVPELLEGTGPEAVAAAAAGLAGAPAGVLVLEPGRERTRPAAPAPASAPFVPTAGRSAAELGRSPLGPRPLPPLAKQPEAALDRAHETRLANGLRVVAVPDARSRTVELRLRIPLGGVGWSRPREVARLLRTVEHVTGTGAAAARLGGELRLTTDGQWADVGGWAPADARTELFGAVARLLDADRLAGTAVTGHRSPGLPPERHMDEVLRLHWLRGRVADRAAESQAALHRAVFAPRGALLVVVGDADPERLAEEVGAAMGAWTAPGAAVPAPPGDAPAAVLVVGSDGARRPSDGGTAHVTLSCPEKAGGSLDPARYLATALFGGHPDSRLARWCRESGNPAHHMYAGRDTVADRARSLVRLSVPRTSMAPAVAGVRAQMRRLATRPPAPPEVAAVARYCAAQLLSAFDSPAMLADALRHTLAAGRDLDWVERRPRLLRAVDGEAVTAAAHALYLASEVTAVALTEGEPTSTEGELRAALQGERTTPPLAMVESHP